MSIVTTQPAQGSFPLGTSIKARKRMDNIDLAYAGAFEQARLIRDGEVSAVDVIAATLSQIDALNPRLNAYRVVYTEQAMADAKRADHHRLGTAPLPLDGVPVAIKDDADIAGEVTAWGTDAYGAPKTADSDVVTRLRAAGAIIIGKTHVPEMTLWPWTASKTWGATRNPWDSERTPGGSSGGSAVAVSTGMCGVALGSDGGGSIRYPAALTGLFGIKPQRNRISLGPDHHDAWNGLSVYGPLARTVRDAALFLDATSDNAPVGGYLAALDTPVRRLRIAVSYSPPPMSFARLADDRRTAVEQTAELLRSLGHEVFEQQIDYGPRAMSNVSVRYLKGLQHDVTTLPRAENLERTTRRLAGQARLLPTRSLTAARKHEAALAARINGVFAKADVVLTPIAGSPPPQIEAVAGKGLIRSLYRANVAAWAAPWNAIGQPAASIPAGFDSDGLPLAIQLCGQPNDETTLLQLAAELEATRPWVQKRPNPHA
jgi:amidase